MASSEITSENFPEILGKAEEKMHEWASYQCGLLSVFEENPQEIQIKEENMQKLLCNEVSVLRVFKGFIKKKGR